MSLIYDEAFESLCMSNLDCHVAKIAAYQLVYSQNMIKLLLKSDKVQTVRFADNTTIGASRGPLRLRAVNNDVMV